MKQLAEFDDVSEDHGRGEHLQRAPAGPHQTDAEKDEHGPEVISEILHIPGRQTLGNDATGQAQPNEQSHDEQVDADGAGGFHGKSGTGNRIQFSEERNVRNNTLLSKDIFR